MTQEGCTSIDTLHILSYELHDTHMAVVLNDDIINFHWSQHTQVKVIVVGIDDCGWHR